MEVRHTRKEEKFHYKGILLELIFRNAKSSSKGGIKKSITWNHEFLQFFETPEESVDFDAKPERPPA